MAREREEVRRWKIENPYDLVVLHTTRVQMKPTYKTWAKQKLNDGDMFTICSPYVYYFVVLGFNLV